MCIAVYSELSIYLADVFTACHLHPLLDAVLYFGWFFEVDRTVAGSAEFQL